MVIEPTTEQDGTVVQRLSWKELAGSYNNFFLPVIFLSIIIISIMRKLIAVQCGSVNAFLNTNCIAPPTFVKYEIDIEEDENGAACLQIAIGAAEVLENNHYLECSGWSCED
jgi:hypothetical protein